MDPVFLIAGASSGIGEATARQAARAGYKVVLAARSEDKLNALAEETGGVAVPTDVTSWEDQQAMVRHTLDTLGRIDVALANAGIGTPRSFVEGDPEDAKQAILTNVYGVYLTIRATMPALKEHQGHLLLTSSIAGRRALAGSLYSATKFSVTAMAEAARQEFNGTGVRTTVIEPGRVETPGFSHDMEGTLEAEDIARAIMFAVSQPPHMDVNEIMIRPTAQDS